jgi:hypothetical protein
VVKQQIVIRTIRSVRPAQKVGARCPVRGNHSCGDYQEQGETTEREEFQMPPAKNNLPPGPPLGKTANAGQTVH